MKFLENKKNTSTQAHTHNNQTYQLPHDNVTMHLAIVHVQEILYLTPNVY